MNIITGHIGAWSASGVVPMLNEESPPIGLLRELVAGALRDISHSLPVWIGERHGVDLPDARQKLKLALNVMDERGDANQSAGCTGCRYGRLSTPEMCKTCGNAGSQKMPMIQEKNNELF